MRGRLLGRAALLSVAVLSLALAPACEQAQEELDEQLGTAAPDLPGVGGDGGAPDGDGVGGDGTGDGGPAAVGDDDGPLGANAQLYLRGDVPALTIEVDAVSGREPSGEALGHLRSTISGVSDKGDVSQRPVETFARTGDRYSRGDLAALEGAHRDTGSTSDAASLYVLVVNGEFAENPNALGVAYSASAFAIFRDKVEEAAGLIGSASTIERAVLVHELGHVLRLVNIGYDSPRDREDPEHPNHSTHEDSVMFWAVESDLISQVLDGPPPDTFDDADRADLEGIKVGRLG